MSEDIKKLAQEAIQVELNIGHLYRLFSKTCPGDTDFWWQLATEENNHAALIKSGVDFFIDSGRFPCQILPEKLKDLQAANKELLRWIEQYTDEAPSRETTFQVGLLAENCIAEANYQNMMTCKDAPEMLKLFQKLNADDKDHIKRIQAYMKKIDLE